MEKSPDAFRTISEVADHLDTPAHVLRFWESRFPQIRPVKRAGGRRYYRPSDVALLEGIRRLLHDEGMTIRGVQKILREQGVRFVAGVAADPDPGEEAGPDVATPRAPVRRQPPTATVIDLPVAPRAPLPDPAPQDLPPLAPAPEPAAAPVQTGAAEAPPAADAISPAAVSPDHAPQSPAGDAPAQLALFPADLPPPAPPDMPPDDDDTDSLLQRLRRLPPGALAPQRQAIAPLVDRLRALADTLNARSRDPRL